jgi:formylglycine-generating enzyme required for sulfatase activity
MVMIKGPVEFRMGSPPWEPDRHASESAHLRRIDRDYAIASTSVTVGQWQRFLKERPEVRHSYTKRYSPEAGGPIVSVTYYEAMAYCNWLSEKERLPACYPKEIGSGMKPYPDHLRRTGYRLPSEAEWEYACKAGSQESRHYGSAIDLMPRYAPFRDNSEDRAWPVGQKRPNDLGLFDVHGNVWNWCGERWLSYPRRRSALPAIDPEDAQIVDESTGRSLRGGSFILNAPYARSSYRDVDRPGYRNNDGGLRVCRTLPPDSFTPLPPP